LQSRAAPIARRMIDVATEGSVVPKAVRAVSRVSSRADEQSFTHTVFDGCSPLNIQPHALDTREMANNLRRFEAAACEASKVAAQLVCVAKLGARHAEALSVTAAGFGDKCGAAELAQEAACAMNAVMNGVTAGANLSTLGHRAFSLAAEFQIQSAGLMGTVQMKTNHVPLVTVAPPLQNHVRKDASAESEKTLPVMLQRQPELDIPQVNHKKAEELAEFLLVRADAGHRIQPDDMLDLLRLWKFRRNTKRANVMRAGQEFVHSEMLGVVRTRAYCKYLVTSLTRSFPSFTRALNHYLFQNVNTVMPPGENFKFTTMCINKGYAAKRHRDNNNSGICLLTAVGKFTGGKVLYWDSDPGPREVPDVATLRLEDAKQLNIHNHFCLLDGRKAHEVEPFEGERYSLIYFTVSGRHHFPKDLIPKLYPDYGIKFPEEGFSERFESRFRNYA